MTNLEFARPKGAKDKKRRKRSLKGRAISLRNKSLRKLQKVSRKTRQRLELPLAKKLVMPTLKGGARALKGYTETGLAQYEDFSPSFRRRLYIQGLKDEVKGGVKAAPGVIAASLDYKARRFERRKFKS